MGVFIGELDCYRVRAARSGSSASCACDCVVDCVGVSVTKSRSPLGYEALQPLVFEFARFAGASSRPAALADVREVSAGRVGCRGFASLPFTSEVFSTWDGLLVCRQYSWLFRRNAYEVLVGLPRRRPRRRMRRTGKSLRLIRAVSGTGTTSCPVRWRH